jgi:A/G-specific adenine glycosylase
MNQGSYFSRQLLLWNDNENTRKMPWKGEKDPYKIWISEIILQQTRVQQGLAYYERFINAFPDVKSLALAPEQKVYKLWEGLGYYSRCANLIATAKFIHEKLDDQFPDQYEDILSLKGVGSYTASAIASFAYNQPYAVLDGNVFRVLSRYFGIEIPINSNPGKKYYSELARQLLDKKNPAVYNQSIMDFGAVICKPFLPLCTECPLQKKCSAWLTGRVSTLPVNEKVIQQKERFFNYLIVQYDQQFCVRKRSKKDIWQNLFEFVLIETDSLKNEDEFLKEEAFQSMFHKRQFEVCHVSKTYSQKLTHQLIHGRFFHIKLTVPPGNLLDYHLVSKQELGELPFPKMIASYLAQESQKTMFSLVPQAHC